MCNIMANTCILADVPIDMFKQAHRLAGSHLQCFSVIPTHGATQFGAFTGLLATWTLMDLHICGDVWTHVLHVTFVLNLPCGSTHMPTHTTFPGMFTMDLISHMSLYTQTYACRYRKKHFQAVWHPLNCRDQVGCWPSAKSPGWLMTQVSDWWIEYKVNAQP